MSRILFFSLLYCDITWGKSRRLDNQEMPNQDSAVHVKMVGIWVFPFPLINGESSPLSPLSLSRSLIMGLWLYADLPSQCFTNNRTSNIELNLNFEKFFAWNMSIMVFLSIWNGYLISFCAKFSLPSNNTLKACSMRCFIFSIWIKVTNV